MSEKKISIIYEETNESMADPWEDITKFTCKQTASGGMFTQWKKGDRYVLPEGYHGDNDRQTSYEVHVYDSQERRPGDRYEFTRNNVMVEIQSYVCVRSYDYLTSDYIQIKVDTLEIWYAYLHWIEQFLKQLGDDMTCLIRALVDIVLSYKSPTKMEVIDFAAYIYLSYNRFKMTAKNFDTMKQQTNLAKEYSQFLMFDEKYEHMVKKKQCIRYGEIRNTL